MEVVLNHLLKRASACYHQGESIKTLCSVLETFLRGNMDIGRLLTSDDGVLNTYFSHWLLGRRCHLERLVQIVFINRRPV